MKKNHFFQYNTREFLFQFFLIVTLFVASAVERHSPVVDFSKFCFFLNYVIASLIISYSLLPRFFYVKKYGLFSIGVTAVLLLVILIEELVLEQIFYPNSRGTSFPGVIHTLLEVLPIILILTGFKFAWDAHQKQQEVERLNTVVAESRLQFLKSQINPHFLFNNLNNLYAYALEQSPKTPKIILDLSSLLRYMLYDCQVDFVPISKEVQCLSDFIRLQELQIEHRGNINFSITGKVQNQQIAPLILIVFVENCFKHSTSSQSEGIQINIQLDIRDNQLSLICNNTFSDQGNTQQLSKGIGLENVRARLALLYPNRHQLTIQSIENNFQVQLVLDLDQLK